MDPPRAASVFRTLLRRRAAPRRSAARRTLATGSPGRREVAWQPRAAHMYQDAPAELDRYPMVTAADLAGRRERPRRVKMWARDFIDDSLYNPHYGYFSKQAVIFTPGAPFDFRALADDLDFLRVLGQRYTEFEDALDAAEGRSDVRQLWHTPTELFRPHYGRAVARYLAANYKLSLYPYHDLVIYELGAGNGTLMADILDHLRAADPDVYERTRYKIIEISPALAALQRSRAAPHRARVEVIGRSIFAWDTYVPGPCFFLALEVFDNFAHDMLRYDWATARPLQGLVVIDAAGDFHEFYTPQLDPHAARFLQLRQLAQPPPREGALLRAALRNEPLWPMQHAQAPLARLARALRAALPLAANLSPPDFIPTRLVAFFDVLREHFPAHRLVAADFSRLPDAVPGRNAPVVQTRYRRETVPVGTIYVHQGYFDILFPTDWPLAECLYRALTGKLTRVMSHADFLRRWCVLHDVTPRSGESPLLGWYQNACFMSSV